MPFDDDPANVAVGPGGRRIYVLEPGGAVRGGQVAAVDAATNRVRSKIQISENAVSLAVGQHDARLYVAIDSTPARLEVIDPAAERIMATVPVGSDPAKLVVSPDGSRLYAAEQALNGARRRPRREEA